MITTTTEGLARVRKIVRTHTGVQPNDVDDIASEAILRLLRARPHAGWPTALVYHCVKFAWVDWCRQREAYRRTGKTGSWDLDRISDRDTRSPDWALDGDQESEVAECLSQGMSMEDTCEHLGMSWKTIARRRETLKNRIEVANRL